MYRVIPTGAKLYRGDLSMPDRIQPDFPRQSQVWFEEWQNHESFFYGHLDQVGEPELESSSTGSAGEETEQWWDMASKYTFHG